MTPPQLPGRAILAPICLIFFLSGCRTPELTMVDADWASCGTDHCAFQPPADFQPVRTDRGILMRQADQDAEFRILVLQSGHAPDAAEAVLEERIRGLGPVARWQQPPERTGGFLVLGASGTRAASERGQQTLVFANTRTGSLLVLEASAPSANWSSVMSALGGSFAEVRLGAAF